MNKPEEIIEKCRKCYGDGELSVTYADGPHDIHTSEPCPHCQEGWVAKMQRCPIPIGTPEQIKQAIKEKKCLKS